jgi:flagellar biosynthesis chaperone FliJ
VTDNSRALKRARRQDSNTKRRQARDTLQAMIESGEPITFAAVARRAGVSVSLLYADSDLASRLTEARHRQQQAGRERAWRLPPRSLVTEQSLRVDLANAKDQVRRLSQEVTLLRDRLARDLGADADVTRGRAISPLLDQLEERAADLEADNAQLRHRLAEVEHALEESNETLEAARAMNRELMTELNRSGQPATVGPANASSTPAAS